MSDMLFYMGQGKTQEEAVKAALLHSVFVLLEHHSLVVELLELNQTGRHWEAHIRLMAVNNNAERDSQGYVKKKGLPALELNPKNPEHFRSGQPFEWRPVGMKHDEHDPFYHFDNATSGGSVPDIPMQEIDMYKRAGWDDDTIRDYMLSQKNEFYLASNNPKLEKA